jgi:3' exoribonuclease, RNase T-like
VLLFLDTEYTGVGQANPKLISLALVAEDGQREFYAELTDTWTLDDCNEFVKRDVLPLLKGPRYTVAHARAELRVWFAEAPRDVQAACDSPTDWRFLLELLGTPQPPNLTPRYFDLRRLIDTTIYDRTVTAFYGTDNRIHHALADARAYRRGWLAWMDAHKAKAV